MKLILKPLIDYLKEPYPYRYDNKKRLFFLLMFISVLSFMFSYFFEPFDVNNAEHKINSIWILLVHAFMPFPIVYLYFNIANRNLKDTATWTLGREILHLSIVLFIVGIVGFLIRDLIYTNPDNWSFYYFWEEIRNTFLVGFLLLIIILPLNLEWLINKHTSSLKKLPQSKTLVLDNTLVVIKSLTSNENFELKIKEFLFAKVESNYTEIVTSSPDGTSKVLLRITLAELEEQLEPVSHLIFKTHRSYLVHLNAIKSISGNAQGYQLSLKNHPATVPVSRLNIPDFNTAYSKV